ncbi:MAG: phosphoglycerate mutase [Lutibacter sp.]|nr:MAG: phosphoglycerate mutase [Lutibacter sp.]
MKKFLFIIIILNLSIQIKAQSHENEITTYYFIRHAEKIRTDTTNKNPNLTEKGIGRAQNWSSVFKHVTFDSIYATNYNRTIQTATPTAKDKNLVIQFYNPRTLFIEDFKLKTIGKTILIVGHSNTTPQFVNKILGTNKYADINNSNNSNLYIVTISNNRITDILLEINL